MIIYFANRQMQILGQASTGLPRGLVVMEDIKTEEVETGIATFSCRIPFTKEVREKTEECTEAGNYILRSDGDDNEFYTIIETEVDTESMDVSIYAEDAGLDLLNEIALEYTADKAYSLTEYVEKWIKDSGFEIGINESTSTTKKLAWGSESTVTERLMDVAGQFGCELSFSFEIKNIAVTHKYVNIYKRRGKDIGIQLRLNQDIDKIAVKTSVANVATALICTGAAPDGSDIPITLTGYKYDDGDFYVDGNYLKSREAVAKWSRYVWDEEPGRLAGHAGHIVKKFNYDTVSQAELCKNAITELKKACIAEVNYEAEITRLPDNTRIGDRINVVDEAGKLYLSARILALETSAAENTRTATLGEYLIKDGGISQKVQELASQFTELAKNDVALENTTRHANETAEYAKQQAGDAQKSAASASNLASSAQGMAGLITKSLGFFQTVVQQGDGSTIIYLHDKPELEESQTRWRISAGVFSVSTDGGKTWSAGIDAQGNAVVNLLSAIGINFDWAKGGQLTLGGKSNANGIFRLLANDGSEMIRMDYEGIKLANGASLISANGVCGNLQFMSNGGQPYPLGTFTVNHDFAIDGNLIIAAYIPKNYVIEEATMRVIASQGFWFPESTQYTGYPKKIKLSKAGNTAGMGITGSSSNYHVGTKGSWSQIVSGGFTSAGPDGVASGMKTITSGNIKKHLTAGALNLFKVSAAAYIKDYSYTGYTYVGSGIAILDVVGYTRN